MQITMDLAPSVVRKIILDEHTQLRRKLSEIETLLKSKDHSKLKEAITGFTRLFLSHIEKEEKILRPVLKEIDAWGGVRVDRMNQEHVAQRAQMKEIVERVQYGKPAEYLSLIEVFVREIYLDIQAEEKECLSPDVMKDDPITTNNTCG